MAGRTCGPGAGRSADAGAGRSAERDTPGGPAGGVLVIGYGNALRSDDGVGWHAARALAGDPRLAGAEVLAVHQLTPELAVDASQARLVVFVDATVEAAPGAVVVTRQARPVRGPGPGMAGTAAVPGAAAVPRPGPVPGPGMAGTAPGATSHHVGLGTLLALAAELYGAAPEVVVVSIGAATMEPGEALSPAVEAALPAVADTVAELVAGLVAQQPAGRRRPR